MIRQITGFLKWLSSAAAVIAVACITLGLNDAAQALIVNADPTGTSNPAPYTAAPTSADLTHGDPGWNYVGAFLQTNGGNGTGVYVGNGWVLTAGHVSTGGQITFGSTSFSLTGAPIPLTNPVGVSGTPDLTLRKISGYLPLPDPVIRASSPTYNNPVVLISTGDDRSSALTAFPNGNSGYYWDTSANGRQQAWGTNNVYQSSVNVFRDTTNATQCFDVRFSNITGEAQAADHDSGGAGFIYNNSLSQWELAGLILNIHNGDVNVAPRPGDPYTPTGQPGNTAAFGNYTFLADLSKYADQINAVVPEPASLALLCLGSLTLLRRRRA
ncbi:MAG: PEP-CTERM sorting domain-containing protein [Phycisphaeraceae bacterium]